LQTNSNTKAPSKIEKILSAEIPPQEKKNFMGSVDTEDFFRLGNELLDRIGSDGSNTIQSIHEYLNLFRFPAFLRRIYEQEKWESLIHDLILKSNYNTNILFNQRLRDYGKKPLFKVINGNTVTEFTWEKSASIIKSYRNALYPFITKDSKVAFLLGELS
jgi:hypothetical protein